MSSACFVILVAMLPTATAIINAGTVLLKPRGVLEMEASWVDSPRDGSYYNIFLLTTIQSTGTLTLHRLNNLRFNDTSMSYRIGEFNKDSFVSGNSQTSGNFPGFKLNNQYRVYIGYFNAANVQLNQAGGQVEMSLHASPMIQASPPLNIRSCAIMDTSTSPCNTLAVLPFSFRIFWDRPASVGYDTYFPNNAYGIDYYRIEVSTDPWDFQNLMVSVICVIGQNNPTCHFDRRVALVTGLTKARVYYYRVMAGTIVGVGRNTTSVASPVIRGAPEAPIAVSLTPTEVSVVVSLTPAEESLLNCTTLSMGNCTNLSFGKYTKSYARNYTFTFAFQAPTDTGDGTSVLAIVYYVQVSSNNFSTLMETATLTSAYPGGLQQNMRWTSRTYPDRTAYSFRVRAANYFDTLGASGSFSDVLSSYGCSVNATWENASKSCVCVQGYYDTDALS